MFVRSSKGGRTAALLISGLLAALVLLLLCTASVTAGSYNPFLYFRF